MRYPHKGILGKLFGYDTMKQNYLAAKEGHFLETARLRNFGHVNTLTMRNFSRDFIMTIEPENIKTILSTKFGDFGLGNLRRETLEPVFGHGIFVSDGKAWENSRAMIRPNFTRHQVADLSVYENHVNNMLSHVPTDGSTVDLQELFFRLTMDSATEFLFGTSTNTLVEGKEHPDAERFTDAFTYVLEKMALDFRTARLNRFVPDKKRKDDSEFIKNFAAKIIRQAIDNQNDSKGDESDKKSYTFLYEMLKVTNDPYILQSETLNVLLAGRDTTASLLSHTFFELARNPNAWAKLQAEIDELGGEAPDYETMKSMKYVKWTLNESLRLFPVVPGNTRIAVRDTCIPLGGGPDQKSPVFVPKGTPVSYSPWSMHRRRDFYGPDSLEFKPERWEKLRPGWEYLPFNGGPRICIGKSSKTTLLNFYVLTIIAGQNFALTEASYVMIRLLQHFRRIEPRDETPWTEFLTLTMAIRNGCKVGLYRE